MRQWIASVGLLCAAAFAMAPSATARSTDTSIDPANQISFSAVDASAYPTVTAVIDDPGAAPGTIYAPESFSVTEDGKPVAATVERVASAQLEIILAVDTSGSMQGAPLAAAKVAARQFLDTLPPEVRVGLVGFGPTAAVEAPTTNHLVLAGRIDGLRATGGTALYDAVVAAASSFDADATDRAIVLLSDGGNSVGATTLETAVGSLTGVRLEAIELVTSDSNPDALGQLAAAGHGSVAEANAPSALADVYRRVASSLVNRYRITFPSKGHGTTQVAVKIRGTDRTAEGVTSFAAPPALPLPPASTTVPATVPVTAPATTAVTVPAPALISHAYTGLSPRTWLFAGAGVLFVALLLLALAVLPRRFSKKSQRRLGVSAAAGVEGLSEVTRKAAGAVEDLLARSGRATRLARSLDVAGIALRPGEFVVLIGTFTLIAGLIGFAAGGLVAAIASGGLVVFGSMGFLDVKGKKRRGKFADDLGATLQVLSSALRSGYALPQALSAVSEEADEPTHGELNRAIVETRLGRNQIDALRAVSDRMDCKDFDWVVSAIEINRDVGGNLAEVLDNVAGTIRERQQLFRQVRSLSAEGRMSAYILTALPIVMAVIIKVANPHYLDALGKGTGLVVLVGAGVLLVVGWFWMRALLKVRF